MYNRTGSCGRDFCPGAAFRFNMSRDLATFCSERPRFLKLQTLFTSLNHFPPSIPVPGLPTCALSKPQFPPIPSGHGSLHLVEPSGALPTLFVPSGRSLPVAPHPASRRRNFFSYGQPVFCPMGTSTPLLVRTFRRTKQSIPLCSLHADTPTRFSHADTILPLPLEPDMIFAPLSP